MQLINSRWTRIALLAACLAPLGHAQGKDPLEGYLRVMKDSFDVWRRAHESFDKLFNAQLKERLDTPREKSAETQFCRSDFPSATSQLKEKLDIQIKAQITYYSKHAEIAKRDFAAQSEQRIRLSSMDNQVRENLKQAEEELEMLKNNLGQLENSRKMLASPSGNPPPGTPGDAPPPVEAGDKAKTPSEFLGESKEHLDNAIKRQTERVETLRGTLSVLADTSQSRERILKATKDLADMSARSVDLLQAQKDYWGSFYSMRESQVLEFCGGFTIAPPSSVPLAH